MLRKVLLSLASAFLAYQSYRLVMALIESAQQLSWGISLLLAYLLSLFVTGVFAFAGFAFPTHRLLPASYFTVQHPHRIQWMYQAFGLRYFKKLLLLFFWGKKKHKQSFFNGRRSGLAQLDWESRQAETGHLLPFIVLNVLSFVLLGFGYGTMALFVIVINGIGNAYPVILQRHHRMRLQSIKRT